MVKIEKVECKKQALIANEFLTKLINYESQFDENMNASSAVDEYYEKDYQGENNCTLLVSVDGKYIGYLHGFIQDRGKVYYEKIAYLDAIYIEEEYRNKKLGRELINEFFMWAKDKKIKYVNVSVFSENKSAISLYKKLGFVNSLEILKKEIL